MELLVVTLAYITPGRDTDVLDRVRLIADTVRNAAGLITSRFYRSRSRDSYYLMLTTWDDEESWKRAQERHNPKKLLLQSGKELLASMPNQWLMHYLWGYNRPLATPVLATSHLITAQPQQIDTLQQSWLQRLRQQIMEPSLASGLLARGTHEDQFVFRQNTTGETLDFFRQQDTILLGLFSWGSEAEREQFYTDPHYQIVNRLITSTGGMQMLPLEPM